MIMTAVVLFLLGAVFGLIMVTKIFRGDTPPWALTVLHGLFGASGLLVLLAAVYQGFGGDLALGALIVLVIAALGGFFLLSFHLRKVAHPKGVVVIHAAAAVVGVLILLVVALQSSAA